MTRATISGRSRASSVLIRKWIALQTQTQRRNSRKAYMSSQFGLWFAVAPLLFCHTAPGEVVQEKETLQKSFIFDASSAARRIEVDNFEGSIKVTGWNQSEARLTVLKTIEGDSPERILTARRDVRLDISSSNNTLVCYADGPFRCKSGSISFRGWEEYGYKVRFDFELAVPHSTSLRLRTVNGEDIVVEKTVGAFDIDNVNGGVRMADISGAGRAYALNGGVRASFVTNPEKACYFGSLNGIVEVAFRPGLSADVYLKTFNGRAYSDFFMTRLPPGEPTRKTANGKFVYKSADFVGLRVAQGGPELKFDAFNGDIRILSKQP